MDPVSFVPFLAAVVAVGLSGVLFQPGAWYATLNKPRWTPPDWLFGPAWTLLYLMIAVAGWRVWQADGFGVPLAFWCLNLVFNAAWSWLMFGRHKIAWALADAAAMLATIVAFVATAAPVDTTAALLFLPYLAWTAFAFALNTAVLRLNPEPAGQPS
jgi:benzodiazapine receptor